MFPFPKNRFYKISSSPQRFSATPPSAYLINQGQIRGRAISPSQNLRKYNFVQFGKQHDIRPFYRPLVCHNNFVKYTSPLTAAKPFWDLTTKYYWNRPPPNLSGWTRPLSRPCHKPKEFGAERIGVFAGNEWAQNEGRSLNRFSTRPILSLSAARKRLIEDLSWNVQHELLKTWTGHLY